MAGKEGFFTNSIAVEPPPSCSAGEKIGEADPAAVKTREAAGEKFFVMMSKERVDYILSRDAVITTEPEDNAEDKTIHFHRQGAVDAWRKSYEQERAEYEARVRKEYEAHGYVKVEAVENHDRDDYDFESRMSDSLIAAFRKAFAADYHLELEVIPEDA